MLTNLVLEYMIPIGMQPEHETSSNRKRQSGNGRANLTMDALVMKEQRIA